MSLYFNAVREEAWRDGAAEGQLYASRRMLLAFIEARFGGVDPWLRWRIDTCKNVEALLAVAQRVGRAERVEDLHLLSSVFTATRKWEEGGFID
jgi:hypothetical protein